MSLIDFQKNTVGSHSWISGDCLRKSWLLSLIHHLWPTNPSDGVDWSKAPFFFLSSISIMFKPQKHAQFLHDERAVFIPPLCFFVCKWRPSDERLSCRHKGLNKADWSVFLNLLALRSRKSSFGLESDPSKRSYSKPSGAWWGSLFLFSKYRGTVTPQRSTNVVFLSPRRLFPEQHPAASDRLQQLPPHKSPHGNRDMEMFSHHIQADKIAHEWKKEEKKTSFNYVCRGWKMWNTFIILGKLSDLAKN